MKDFELIAPGTLGNDLINNEEDDLPVVLEAHFSSVDHPLDGAESKFRHLPGAIQVHPSYLESGNNVAEYYPNYDCPENGNLLPHAELAAALERLGITPRSSVVVYGSEPDGTMAAARLVWGLLVAGVKNVKLLDGGIGAWLAIGGETVRKTTRATDIAEPQSVTTLPWRARSKFVTTTHEVQNLTRLNGNAPAKLIDVRDRGEYDGSLNQNYTFFSKAGHIPGAVLQGDWENLVDMKTHRLGPKLEEVRRRWQRLGIIDEGVERGVTSLIFYCGTGWRSSISFLIAHLLGLRASNYDDGFYGWSWRDDNEIAFGGPG